MVELVNCRRIELYKISLSMLVGKSPKIKYICGKCGGFNKTRISMESIRLRKPYTKCSLCGEVNNLGLKL